MIRIEYQGASERSLRILYGNKVVDQALVRTQNRVLATARTALNKQARSVYAIKARDINAAAKIRKASFSKPDAILSFIGPRLPLKAFSPKSRVVRVNTVRGKAKRRQVSVKITKQGGRVKITSVPAFLTNTGEVMIRTTKSRTPIKVAMTVSIPEMIDTKPQLDAFDKTVAERFPIEFERNMDFYLSKL